MRQYEAASASPRPAQGFERSGDRPSATHLHADKHAELPRRSVGAGLTAAKMKDCRWLKPVLVAHIEFLEWTGDSHLRHTKFIALRDDKPARDVRRE